MVRPWLEELFSMVLIWSASCVVLSSLKKVVNCPAFSRIWEMFLGPEGVGAGEDCAVALSTRKREQIENIRTSCCSMAEYKYVFSNLMARYVRTQF